MSVWCAARCRAPDAARAARRGLATFAGLLQVAMASLRRTVLGTGSGYSSPLNAATALRRLRAPPQGCSSLPQSALHPDSPQVRCGPCEPAGSVRPVCRVSSVSLVGEPRQRGVRRAAHAAALRAARAHPAAWRLLHGAHASPRTPPTLHADGACARPPGLDAPRVASLPARTRPRRPHILKSLPPACRGRWLAVARPPASIRRATLSQIGSASVACGARCC